MFQPAPVSEPPVSRHTSPAEAPVSPPEAAPEALPPEARAALASLLGSGRVVAHRPCFARLFGGAACGVLLSQFWFWTGTPTVQARAGGWFWKPQREITEETGLTRTETATARRRLCAQGILEEKRCGIPSTLHFRLDMGAVLRRLWASIQAQAGAADASSDAAMPQTGMRGTRTLVRANPASQFAGIMQTTSEIISERTQETTQTRARPVLPSAFPDRIPERSAEGATFSDRGAVRGASVTEAVFGTVLRAVAGATGAAGAAGAGGTAISTGQQAVNLSGVARFKAALAAARRGATREPPPPGVWKPPAEGRPSDGDLG